MRITRASTLLLASSWLVCLSAQAEIQSECLQVEQRFAANDIETLQSLELKQPRWQALQQFRLAAAYIPADQRKAAGNAIRAGLRVVAAQLKEEPDNVELLIFGAMLDGQYLLLQPWRFVWNGRRGLQRISRAEELDAGNPRIALVRGTAKFILPRFLGGSAQEAQEIFAAALAQPRATGTPYVASALCQNGEWGQVDILNWLARAYAKQDEQELAHDTFVRAAEYSPGNYWVELALKGEGYEWTPNE